MATAMTVAGENWNPDTQARQDNGLKEFETHTLTSGSENKWGVPQSSTISHHFLQIIKTSIPILWFAMSIGTIVFAACLVSIYMDEKFREEQVIRDTAEKERLESASHYTDIPRYSQQVGNRGSLQQHTQRKHRICLF